MTSFVALYANRNGIEPPALYFTIMSIAILATRHFIGRLADRVGYCRILLPCLVMVAAGLGLLAVAATRPWLVASALTFGVGFGSAYPVFAAYVMRYVSDDRRGAAFGSVIGAFDTGIGTGSIAVRWIVEHYSFAAAFGTAALLAAGAMPCFVITERRLRAGAAPNHRGMTCNT